MRTALCLVCILVVGILLGSCDQSEKAQPSATAVIPTQPSSTAAAPIPDAKLIIRSGFEQAVLLNSPVLRFGQWRQELRGADQSYDWSSLPGSPADFQYLVSGSDAKDADTLKRFVETRIDTVSGPDGKNTQALYQAVRADGTIGRTQNDFIIFNMQNHERGYLRYWMMLQPDLLDLMTQNGDWRVLMEWKETPAVAQLQGFDFQYRWLVTLSRAKPGKDSSVDGIVWKVEGDNVAPNQRELGTLWTDDWTVWNRDLPVPLGRWFLFEVQWELGPQGEGRVLVRADGHLVADARNRTQQSWTKGKLYLFMTYMSAESYARGEAYQWIDDMELWLGGE